MRKNFAAGLLAVALALPGATVVAQADTVPSSEGNSLLAQAEPAASTPTQVVNEFYKEYIDFFKRGSRPDPDSLYKRFLAPDLFRLYLAAKNVPSRQPDYDYFGGDLYAWIDEATVIGGETNGGYARVDVLIGRDSGAIGRDSHPEYVRFKAKMFMRLVNGEWRIDNFVYNYNDLFKHRYTNNIYNLRNRLEKYIQTNPFRNQQLPESL